MKKSPFFPAVVIAIVGSVSVLAHAQSPRLDSGMQKPAATATPVATEQTHQAASQPIVIGSATESLLHLQRNMTSTKPRYIDGAQASRSYQRYLKSFETNIPEKYEAGVDVK